VVLLSNFPCVSRLYVYLYVLYLKVNVIWLCSS